MTWLLGLNANHKYTKKNLFSSTDVLSIVAASEIDSFDTHNFFTWYENFAIVQDFIVKHQL